MTEIKRYEIYDKLGPMELEHAIEDPEGTWVRWEDVERLSQEHNKETDEYIYEIQLLNERINRLVKPTEHFQYTIAKHKFVTELEGQIFELIQLGWRPHGSLVFAEGCYVQPMVRVTKE